CPLWRGPLVAYDEALPAALPLASREDAVLPAPAYRARDQVGVPGVLFELEDRAVLVFAEADRPSVREADRQDLLSVAVVVDVPLKLRGEVPKPVADPILVGELLEQASAVERLPPGDHPRARGRGLFARGASSNDRAGVGG